MQPFDKSEEATLIQPPSARLAAFTKAVWDALVPSNGECASVQGELVRARERLASEYYRNGMSNYYFEPFEENYFAALLQFVLGILVENRGGALADEDVVFFADIRGRVESDWVRSLARSELEQQEEPLTVEQEKQYDLLDVELRSSGIHWEEFSNRAERCIANWCIANPKLVDRSGHPSVERGVSDIRHVFEPPAPAPKCPMCQGRGFIQPKDPTKYPERCSCTGPNPRVNRC
jgi:hypothetical protein